jgi:sialate O-acetylesterase
MKRLSSLLFALLLAGPGAARADVTLAPLFTDRAVLQCDKPVPVWGKAAPGEKVRVAFRGLTAATTAGTDGRWIVFLEKLAASAQGAELTVTGANTLVVRDVLVGEVWLCSGQSNMEMTVDARAGTWQANTRVTNAAAEIAAANFPLIRHVRIEQTVAEAPADTARTSSWEPATPRTVGGFTAVGYFFARDLFQKLGVPIGIVHASWGGTPVEAWMSPAALASRPEFNSVRERWAQSVAAYPANRAAYEQALAAWTKAEATAGAEVAPAAKAKAAKAKSSPEQTRAAWLKQNPRPRAPRGPGDPWTPSGLFNGMINPLLPYALRGALWYQGESNAERAHEYHALFTATIAAWRAHFGQGDFPFYWVNLANYTVGSDASGASWAALREAQTKTLALPHTGQAIAIDLGDPKDIHPANKQDVGRRLALLAKTRIQGLVGDDTGPTFSSATREGGALRVRFTHATGLIARDKPVQSLELAGADRRFFPATARIERDTLIVSAPQVQEPVAVRYAWKNAPEANLYNSAGLPAVPFRSDSW